MQSDNNVCRFLVVPTIRYFLYTFCIGAGSMDTFFAPSERSDKETLDTEISFANDSQVVSSLMELAGGLLAVVNSHRQVVALNEGLLKMLNIKDTRAALGLRLGEAVGCIHAHDMPGGCGTSETCVTCGAAISMVVSLATGEATERQCFVTVERDQKLIDLYLDVKAQPIRIKDNDFVLLFLQDITREQQLSCLERTFLHDLSNIISGLLGATELLETETDSTDLTKLVAELSQRLAREVEWQRTLAGLGEDQLRPSWNEVTPVVVIEKLAKQFEHHTAARNKTIMYPETLPDCAFRTDSSLLLRVLANMLLNALEASGDGDQVKVGVTCEDSDVVFSVWNRQVIPRPGSLRIFQRNYSTKAVTGRGLGTYSMKLIGEKVLGGEVDFASVSGSGTKFRIKLPISR